jgi:hypothetical protein
MEAEWLAEAITACRYDAVFGIGVEFRSEPEVTAVVPARDDVLEFNGLNSWRFALLTSSSEHFLYYKDEANRFYLVCGTRAFVTQAFKCSWDTARLMYFDWLSLPHHSEEEKGFLTRVWDKYSAFRY